MQIQYFKSSSWANDTNTLRVTNLLRVIHNYVIDNAQENTYFNLF